MKKNGPSDASTFAAAEHNNPAVGATGAKKANPNAVLAKEKKAATQLGVIVGMTKLV